MVAEWSKTLISQIQVDNNVAYVQGLNPALDLHAILGSKSLGCDMALPKLLPDILIFQDRPNRGCLICSKKC